MKIYRHMSGVLCFVLLWFLLSYPVRGEVYVYDGGVDTELDSAWTQFLDTLPAELQKEAETLSLQDQESWQEFLTPSYWLDKLEALLLEKAIPVLNSFTGLLGMLLVLAGTRQWNGMGTGTVFAFCSDVCMALAIFHTTKTVFTWLQTFVEQLCRIMTGLLPVMTAISYSAGEVTTATVDRMALSLFITVLNTLQRWLFFPLGQAIFGISILSTVCTQVSLGSFAGSIKKLFMTLYTFMLVIYSFIYGIQNTLSRSADSLGLRTVRFAMGSFIPIVGSTLAEAFSAVREGLNYIRITAGLSGILVLLLFVLPMVVSVWLYDAMLQCSHTAAECLGCTASARMLADTRSILQLLSALSWMAATFFVFALILFTKTAVFAG